MHSTSTSTSSSSKSSGDPRHAHPKEFPHSIEQSPTGLESRMTPQPDHGEKTYKGLGRLEGKHALITGADSGIGKAVALAFSREGADIGCAYFEGEDDAKGCQQLVKEADKQCEMLPADLCDDSNCKRIVDQFVKRFGQIDVLVLNHALQGKAIESLSDLTPERVNKTFSTNIISFFSLVKYAMPHMKPGSCIITVSSIQAFQPSFAIMDYASTKAAIVGFTKALAPKLMKENGIRVNCVAPGPVWTPLVVSSFPEEKTKEFGQGYPISRAAQPAEIAPAFVFLASNESQYISGAVIGATGGEPLMA